MCIQRPNSKARRLKTVVMVYVGQKPHFAHLYKNFFTLIYTIPKLTAKSYYLSEFGSQFLYLKKQLQMPK